MTARPDQEPLRRFVARELATPAPPALDPVVAALASRYGRGLAAVLFYGACRRTGDLDGLVDLYVLLDPARRAEAGFIAALFDRLLPPTVIHLAAPSPSGPIAAKVAIIPLRQFAARMRPAALDTTIWTRFCQPASLVHARDAAARHAVEAAVAHGVRTAARWADRFGGWQALFERTYRLELRPESRARGAEIHRAAAPWFDEVARLVRDERPHPLARAWLPRRLLGRPLNLLRLAKAAFTFEGGAEYIGAKLGRHSGVSPVPTPWQRRHPLLGAPALWLRHRALRNAR